MSGKCTSIWEQNHKYWIILVIFHKYSWKNKINLHSLNPNITYRYSLAKHTLLRFSNNPFGKYIGHNYAIVSQTPIYTVRQKLRTTWLVSIISFLIMNLFQIGLLFSLPVYTYLLTCETGYRSICIYVYMTGCVKCHVYFSTFVFANESWFFCVEF
jgi:hypothetical protein